VQSAIADGTLARPTKTIGTSELNRNWKMLGQDCSTATSVCTPYSGGLVVLVLLQFNQRTAAILDDLRVSRGGRGHH
jgi:hypothetical protein